MFHQLREHDIRSAHMVCYHFRLQSLAACKRKMGDSNFYSQGRETEADMMSTDFSEIEDATLRVRRLAQLGIERTN